MSDLACERPMNKAGQVYLDAVFCKRLGNSWERCDASLHFPFIRLFVGMWFHSYATCSRNYLWLTLLDSCCTLPSYKQRNIVVASEFANLWDTSIAIWKHGSWFGQNKNYLRPGRGEIFQHEAVLRSEITLGDTEECKSLKYWNEMNTLRWSTKRVCYQYPTMTFGSMEDDLAVIW